VAFLDSPCLPLEVEVLEEGAKVVAIADVGALTPPRATAAAPPAPPKPVAGAPTVASVTAFIDSFRLPLEEPMIKATPRAWIPRRRDADWTPRRSVRLAAKAASRDPNPERQAKRILINKWKPGHVNSDTPDSTVHSEFRKVFAETSPTARREAMSILFPLRADRILSSLAEHEATLDD
jgi:hypothetical protein